MSDYLLLLKKNNNFSLRIPDSLSAFNNAHSVNQQVHDIKQIKQIE